MGYAISRIAAFAFARSALQSLAQGMHARFWPADVANARGCSVDGRENQAPSPSGSQDKPGSN
jgi:hypothetical protein